MPSPTSSASPYDLGIAIRKWLEANPGQHVSVAAASLGIQLTKGLRCYRIACMPENILDCWSDRSRITLRGGTKLASILAKGGEEAFRVQITARKLIRGNGSENPERQLLSESRALPDSKSLTQRIRLAGSKKVVGQVRLFGGGGLELRISNGAPESIRIDVLEAIRALGLHIK